MPQINGYKNISIRDDLYVELFLLVRDSYNQLKEDSPNDKEGIEKYKDLLNEVVNGNEEYLSRKCQEIVRVAK